MSNFLHHDGRSVYVQGYTAVFDRYSVPLDRNGGRRETIKSDAFDHVVTVQPRGLVCAAYHLEGPGFASIYGGNLKIWTDDYGLGFQAGPLKPTPTNRGILAAIVGNELRGCSWLATPTDESYEVIAGEEVRVISKFESVEHIGPVEEGAYPDAVCWCSHEAIYDLPSPMWPVVERWHAHRQVFRSKAAAAARRHLAASAATISRQRENPRGRPVAAVTRPQPAPAILPVTDEEWAGPPPSGFTLASWIDFGEREALHRWRLKQDDKVRRQRRPTV